MTSWPTRPLCELLIALENGSRPKGGVTELDDGIPSLGGEHLNYEGGIQWQTPKHVTREFYNEMKRGHIQRNDILIVKDGATTGKTVTIREDFPFREAAINEHIFLLRTDNKVVLPEYLGYFLFGPFGQQQILSNFHGAAIGGIAQDFVRNVQVPLPPLSDQMRIVKLLNEVQAIRKLRTQADRCTASLIPALFHELFGNPEHTRFPVKQIAELILPERPITYGILKPGPDIVEGVPYVRVLDIKQNRLHSHQLRKTSNQIAEQYRRSSLLPGDILVTIRGTVGRTCIVPNELKGANITQDTARLAVTMEVETSYVVEFLNTPWAQSWMNHRMLGQAVKGLNLGELRRLPVPVPPIALQKSFADQAADIRKLEAEQTASGNNLNACFHSMLHQAFRAEL